MCTLRTRASALLLLVLCTSALADSEELERFGDGSGNGCGCGDMAERTAQIEASVFSQLEVSEEQNSRQSEQISELIKAMKKSGESTGKLWKQVTTLAAQVQNDDELKEQVRKLDKDLTDTNDKLNNLTQLTEELTDQLSEMSEGLDGSGDNTTDDSARWPPRDCSDLPGPESGVQLLYLGTDAGGETVAAYCDMETDGGGWTVIQRRDNIWPRQNFNRRWNDYKSGFGEPTGEFWWGLENIRALTSQTDSQYQLRVDLVDWEGSQQYALYHTFNISSEADGYRLAVSGYSGDAGDSLSAHSGRQFSTRDRDSDGWLRGSCARTHHGGWWYGDCGPANLNGRYISGGWRRRITTLSWDTARRNGNSLRTVTMKVRPTPQATGE